MLTTSGLYVAGGLYFYFRIRIYGGGKSKGTLTTHTAARPIYSCSGIIKFDIKEQKQKNAT